MKFPKIALAMVLSCALVAQGCSQSQVNAVLNEIGPAVLTILQIIAVVKGTPVNTSLSSKVNSDVASVETLYTDFSSASATSKPGIEGQLNAAMGVLNNDLNDIYNVAQVSDKNTQAKITALVGLIGTAINIVEATLPSTPSAMKASLQPTALNASGLADSWNKILVAKTGNAKVDDFTKHAHKIHNHGFFVRTITVGVAK
jgi:hypothetical protein